MLAIRLNRLTVATFLAEYPPEIDALLERILEDHGLVVCGWSATWDPALRRALQRQRNRRYTTYWTGRGELSPEAADLVTARDAVVIDIVDADQFLTRLADQVEALAERARPHPLSTATAVAELKLYVADPAKRVRLRDLVVAEADQLRDKISDERFPVTSGQVTEEDLRERVAAYEALAETLVALMAVGSGLTQVPGPFVEAIELVANPSTAWGGNSLLLNLRRYSGLLCLYAGGIAAVHAGQWEVFRALLYDPIVVRVNEQLPAAAGLSPWVVFDQPSGGKWLPGMDRRYTPVSDHLFDLLRDSLRSVIKLEARYEDTFDHFEYLYGLVVQDQDNQRERRFQFRAPVGRFGWRRVYQTDERQPPDRAIPSEAEAAGEGWPPLRGGLFGGDLARLRSALEQYQEVVDWAHQRWSR